MSGLETNLKKHEPETTLPPERDRDRDHQHKAEAETTKNRSRDLHHW